MARGSIGRTVSRAAKTGGSRNRRGPKQTPLGFYTTLVVVVLLGIASVAFSRYEVLHPSQAAATGPKIGAHSLVAYAFDLCGKVEPNPPKNPDKATPQIYTTGNGLIQVDPTTKADAGKNATLGRFVTQYSGMELSSTSVGYPGKAVLKNGDKCGSKPGKVQARVFSSLADTTGTLVKGNPADLHLTNGSLVTIAFVAAGTAIPRPPSASALAVAATASTTTTTTTTKTAKSTKTAPTTAKKPTKTTATTAKTAATTAKKATKTSATTGS